MIDDRATFKPRAGIVLSGDEKGRFLTDLTTGQVYELNETAAVIFEAARRGDAALAIVEELARRYADVPREEIDRDAREALDEFVARGILERGA